MPRETRSLHGAERRRQGPPTAPHSELVIGITTVRRPEHLRPNESVAAPPRYLTATVSNLLASMTDDDCRRVRIIVHNANDPPSDHHEAVLLQSQAADAPCPITVVAGNRPREPLEKGGQALDYTHDSAERRAWRSKQCLDYAHTLRLCRESDCEYVLMMEDDVVATERFVPKTLDWLRNEMCGRDDWLFVALWTDDFPYDAQPFEYEAGAVALLFRNDAELDRLAEHIESRFSAAPVDWLLGAYLIKTGLRAYARIPSLFEHVGRVRSYGGADAVRGYVAISPSFRKRNGGDGFVALRRALWRLRRFFRSCARRMRGLLEKAKSLPRAKPRSSPREH